MDATDQPAALPVSTRSRFKLDTNRLLISGLLSLLMGSAVGALFFLPFLLLSNEGWDLQTAASIFPAVVIGMGVFGLLTLSILYVVLIVPMGYFWNRGLSVKWMTLINGAVGALITGSPWAFKALYQSISYRVVYTPAGSQDGLWILPTIWCGTGLLFSGLFGFWYAYLEKRATLKTSVNGSDKEVPRSTGRSANVANWTLIGLILLLAFLVVLMATLPIRLVASARRTAVANQVEILEEARQILAAAKLAPDGYISYDSRRGNPLPKHFRKMGDISASASDRLPGAVKVSVTSGFTHTGIFIVPDPTSSTLSMLKENVVGPENGSLAVINRHIFEYSEGP